jgi:hypothetical protein
MEYYIFPKQILKNHAIGRQQLGRFLERILDGVNAETETDQFIGLNS